MQDVGVLFGQRLKQLLDAHDERQVDLARLLNVTEATVSRYLKGRIPDDARTLVTIADHFGVTVDYLLSRTSDRQADPNAARAAQPDPATTDELVVLFRGRRQQLPPEYQRVLIDLMEKAHEKAEAEKVRTESDQPKGEPKVIASAPNQPGKATGANPDLDIIPFPRPPARLSEDPARAGKKTK